MENFYIFGGQNRHSKFLSDIVKYDPKLREWSKSGQLTVGRTQPSVAISGSTIIVVGGSTDHYASQGLPIETCHLYGEQFQCESQVSYLPNYSSYPLLFAVADDYGKNC